MSSVRVNLGPRSYAIAFSHKALDQLPAFLGGCCKSKQALIIADENVAVHALRVFNAMKGASWDGHLTRVPPGENQKTLARAEALYDRLIDLPADRRTLIIALGGGVIGDLAGFVAATYARGLPLFMIPTTLLAMVDSSVGGKVAVNHPRGKNMIGVFHQPVGVWIDTSFLDTLPDREYRSGLAEVVKYGVILDEEFFRYLEANTDAILKREPGALAHIVRRSCELKARVVEQDEREETGLRAILNYGHTFAHAFEIAAGYGAWLHGEAVAAGMMCAARLAEVRGGVTAEFVDRQQKLLHAFSLPASIPTWDMASLLSTMRSDKKALAGKMRFILAEGLGKVALVDGVPDEQVKETLRWAMAV